METRTIPRFDHHAHMLLNVDEAASELGVCRRVVYDLCKSADFPTVKIGRRVFVSRAGLAEWVRNQEQNQGGGYRAE